MHKYADKFSQDDRRIARKWTLGSVSMVLSWPA